MFEVMIESLLKKAGLTVEDLGNMAREAYSNVMALRADIAEIKNKLNENEKE
jgi:N-acyl-L-homoserine lactone synthetase